MHAHQQADGGPCAAEGPVGGCSALRRRPGLELDPPSTVQQRAGACHVILSGIEDGVAPPVGQDPEKIVVTHLRKFRANRPKNNFSSHFGHAH